MADKTCNPNADRQQRFRTRAIEQGLVRTRAIEQGLVQCCVWIPAAAMPDMQLQAELLRKHAHLAVGPLWESGARLRACARGMTKLPGRGRLMTASAPPVTP
jgi:hypothetical protein